MSKLNRYFPNELRLTRIQLKDIEENNRFTSNMKLSPEIGAIRSAIWFVPNFAHVMKGGLRTIFKLAEGLSIKWGTKNIIVIDNFFNRVVLDDLQQQLLDNFPKLNFELINLKKDDSPADLPETDAGFCTLWVTAYTLAKYNKCQAKFYIMQDYEPMFYPGGSISAAIEQTYRLGFYFIANTPGIASKFQQYSDWGMEFIPGVDTKLYSPSGKNARKKGPFNIVYYGRPNNDRNCFDLGCEALRIVKDKLGKNVNIVSVGAEYPILRYGLRGILENKGLLKTMDEVASLYRESDLGLSIMATPHPSYQPLEYMASGCPAVTNINELNNWLYDDGKNIILSEPIYNIMADRIIGALEDSDLRQRVIEGGLRTVSNLSWDGALQIITDYIGNPTKYDTIDHQKEAQQLLQL
jgi:glycosyltransferase involved in cell wall biosynthesis